MSHYLADGQASVPDGASPVNVSIRACESRRHPCRWLVEAEAKITRWILSRPLRGNLAAASDGKEVFRFTATFNGLDHAQAPKPVPTLALRMREWRRKSPAWSSVSSGISPNWGAPGKSNSIGNLVAVVSGVLCRCVGRPTIRFVAC